MEKDAVKVHACYVCKHALQQILSRHPTPFPSFFLFMRAETLPCKHAVLTPPSPFMRATGIWVMLDMHDIEGQKAELWYEVRHVYVAFFSSISWSYDRNGKGLPGQQWGLRVVELWCEVRCRVSQ